MLEPNLAACCSPHKSRLQHWGSVEQRHAMCAAWQVLQQVSQHVVVLADSIADVLAASLKQDVRRRKKERNKGLQQDAAVDSEGHSPTSMHAELLTMWKERNPTTWGEQLTEDLASLLIVHLDRQDRRQEVAHIFASQLDHGKVCCLVTSAPRAWLHNTLLVPTASCDHHTCLQHEKLANSMSETHLVEANHVCKLLCQHSNLLQCRLCRSSHGNVLPWRTMSSKIRRGCITHGAGLRARVLTGRPPMPLAMSLWHWPSLSYTASQSKVSFRSHWPSRIALSVPIVHAQTQARGYLCNQKACASPNLATCRCWCSAFSVQLKKQGGARQRVEACLHQTSSKRQQLDQDSCSCRRPHAAGHAQSQQTHQCTDVCASLRGVHRHQHKANRGRPGQLTLPRGHLDPPATDATPATATACFEHVCVGGRSCDCCLTQTQRRP